MYESHDGPDDAERVRLAALSMALQYHEISPTGTPPQLVETAEAFRAFLTGDQRDGREVMVDAFSQKDLYTEAQIRAAAGEAGIGLSPMVNAVCDRLRTQRALDRAGASR